MEAKQEYKIVDWRLYDPVNSIFKSKSTDRAEFRKSFCSNSENCELFLKGQCTLYNFGVQKCPYGYIKKEVGYTKRFMNYASFINESKDSVSNISQLNQASSKLCIVGDYIYFPYPHWYLNDKLPDDIKGGIFTTIDYVPKNLFTEDFLYITLTFKPHAMMGGEIKRYQKEVVPKIILHLKEEMPSLFHSLISIYPELVEFITEENNIGRKAIIKTLRKGCEILTDKGKFIWDGEQMVCNDYRNVFNPFKGESTIKITPNEVETYKVTDNNQVDSNTKYID